MKKIYSAPSTLNIELRAVKMMALSYTDQEINEDNLDDFDQNAREENINDNNGGNIWDNAW